MTVSPWLERQFLIAGLEQSVHGDGALEALLETGPGQRGVEEDPGRSRVHGARAMKQVERVTEIGFSLEYAGHGLSAAALQSGAARQLASPARRATSFVDR
jgi:hypothetical protein